MTRRTRVGSPGLLLRHFRDGAGTSVLVALLILATVFAVAVVPRALTQLGTDEFRYRVDRLSPLQRDVTAIGLLGARGLDRPETVEDMFGAVDEFLDEVPQGLDQPLAAALGPASWATFAPKRAVGELPVPVGQVQPFVALAIDLDWMERIRIVDGALPTAWTGDEDDDLAPADRPPIEVVLPVETAALMELSVGDVVVWTPAPLELVGTYEPVDPSDEYWQHVPELAEPTEEYSPAGHTVTGAGFADPATALGMFSTFRSSTLRVWYPVDASALDLSDAPQLIDQIASLEAIGDRLPTGETLTFRTGVEDVIEAVVGAVAAVSSLLALMISGPLGVILAVYATGVQAVIRRRARTLTLASARGASDPQLRAAMAAEGFLLAVPAGAVAVLLAVLAIPGPVDWAGLLPPIALVLLPPILFAVFASPGSFRAGRRDLLSGGRRRWIIEAIVGGLAALSLFLLFRRGLVASSEAVGIDPLLAATPLLLSLAVCLLVLRLLPLPLRALGRGMRARRGAIGLLGTARALREPALGFTAALALVVGISVAVFSSVLASTVDEGLRTAAQQQVGADIQVRAPQLPPELVDAVGRVDGVTSVAPIALSGGADLTVRSDAPGVPYSTGVTMVFTDLAALREQRPGMPPTDGGGPMPLLISSDLEQQFAGRAVTLGDLPATIAGVLPTDSVPGAGTRWVLLDAAFAPGLVEDAPGTDRLLIGADGGLPAVAAAVRELVTEGQRESNRPAVNVTDRATVLALNETAPVVGGVRLALILATVAALLLSALTVVLASIAAAASRHRILGVIRVLGTTTGKLRALLAWELAPIAVLAVVAGTLLGLVLPWIVTAAVDLRPFVGGSEAPRPVVDPLLVGGVILVFAVVVGLAGALAVAIGRRRDPNATLKMGAE